MNIKQILTSFEIPQKTLQLLIAHAIDQPPTFLFSNPEYELSREEQTKLESFITRTKNHEPLQYITNTREFYGLDFYIDKRALIPRPETEDLVEEVLKHIRHSSKSGNPDPHLREDDTFTVVEVGTGNGAIAIALAKHTKPNVRIIAIEISADALEVAKLNAKTHGVTNRIKFLHGSLLEPISHTGSGKSVDLIVANLPYIAEHIYQALEPHIKDHEPRIALVGGATGMELYHQLFEQAKQILKPGSPILYELDGRVCIK